MMVTQHLKHLLNVRNFSFCQWQTLRTLTILPNKPWRVSEDGGTAVAHPVLCQKRLHPLLYPYLENVRIELFRCTSTGNNSADTGFPFKEDIFFRYVESLQKEYDNLTESKDSSSSSRKMYLQEIVEQLREYKQKVKDKKEIQELLAASSSDDADLQNMMESEQIELDAQIENIKLQLADMLLPRESVDKNNIILEVSAAVGGQEAAHFTKEMFDMYRRYAQYKGWEFEVLEEVVKTENTVEGLTSASASISGPDVYKLMKFESGVHRVQRVPKTDFKQRLHTSTMTVAILPQPTDIDINIDKKDLKIETFRGSGKGGQAVQKLNSAVRVIHLPSGLKAESCDERSPHLNQSSAIKTLRARLFQLEYEKQIATTQRQRKVQVGTAGRSEKIRTYNYPQNRVTEHRIHLSVFEIDRFMSGGEELDEMIQSVLKFSQQEVLMETLEEFEKKENSPSKTESKDIRV